MPPIVISRKQSMPAFLTQQDVRVRRNLRDMSFIYLSVVLVFCFIAVVSVFLWSRLTVVNTGYEISRANSERNMLLEQNKRLRLELHKLKSPERIEKIAAGELQLGHPASGQIIDIE